MLPLVQRFEFCEQIHFYSVTVAATSHHEEASLYKKCKETVQ